tara:strand:+ start:1118 stop:1561 length:444 start_codon:yes stop_codon:yes gene_type:complete
LKLSNRTVILCDLDGTLSDYSERVHLYKEKDYKSFNEAGINDKPIEKVCEIIRNLHSDAVEVIVMTARDESCRRNTALWLYKNKIPFDQLLMRPENDFSSDQDCKSKLFEIHFDIEDIWFVLEDRNSVVDMWREKGLTCLQVSRSDF